MEEEESKNQEPEHEQEEEEEEASEKIDLDALEKEIEELLHRFSTRTKFFFPYSLFVLSAPNK